jgi:hypothetical protein
MTSVRWTVLGLLLATFSQGALAFQETTVGKGAAPAAPATQPATGLSSTPLPRASGPEIRVPGLGSIGSLPKLDFGLELLYGAGEPKGPREELNKTDPSDLQIRGTVKYKFGN